MKDSSYKKSIRKIKQELSNYNPLSSLSCAIDYLNEHKNSKKAFETMPWIIQFVIKLAMINGNAHKRDITKHELLTIANKLFHMQSVAADLSGHNIHGNLRPMLLQQLWYQRDLTEDLRSMIRQLNWFNEDTPYYSEQFYEITGLTVDTYITISFYICMQAIQHAKGGVSELNVLQLIYFLSPKIGLKEIFLFLKLAGIRASDLPDYYKFHDLPDEPQAEFFQAPVLKYKPLIIDGNKIYILTSQVCVAGLTAMIPIILKKRLKEDYKTQLGTLMEVYIGQLMSEAGLNFLCERDLLKIYARHGCKKNKQVCDFAILGEKNILVESKAIEPNDIVTSSADMDLLKKNLTESFVKSINQGQRTASILNLEDKDRINSHYLVVVTHEEFWFPTGRDVCEMIDKDLEKQIIKEYGTPPIPLERIGFITVSMLEQLTQLSKQGDIDFSEIIIKSFARLEAKENKRPSFGITIAEVIGRDFHPHESIRAKALDFFDGVLASAEENRKYWANRAARLLFTHQKLMVSLDVALGKGY